jgi:hypothetical protein
LSQRGDDAPVLPVPLVGLRQLLTEGGYHLALVGEHGVPGRILVRVPSRVLGGVLGRIHPHEYAALTRLFVPQGAALDAFADRILFNPETPSSLLDGHPVLGRVPVLAHGGILHPSKESRSPTAGVLAALAAKLKLNLS